MFYRISEKNLICENTADNEVVFDELQGVWKCGENLSKTLLNRERKRKNNIFKSVLINMKHRDSDFAF